MLYSLPSHPPSSCDHENMTNTKPLILAQTNFRKNIRRFGITGEDRRYHIYLIGKTGAGKTTLLENCMLQDGFAGRGFIFLDPHGDSSQKLFQIFQKRGLVATYFDPLNNPLGIGYNPIRPVPLDRQSLAVSGILDVFRNLWSGPSWGVRMEHIFRNCLFTLYAQPKATLADILRLLNDEPYRNYAIKNLTNPVVKDFWIREFSKYSGSYSANSIGPIQNKVGAFLSNPVLSSVLISPKTNLSFRKIMDEGQILLVNLSKGALGEDASHLLGGLLMTSVGLAAFSRADIPEEKRRDCALYVDEFHNFTTASLVNMTSELRKFRVSLVLAHQYLDQLSQEIRSSVLGNAGTLICFRLGPGDAAYLEKEFSPIFDRNDLMNLANYDIYLKLLINGRPSCPFSATTLPSQGVLSC